MYTRRATYYPFVFAVFLAVFVLPSCSLLDHDEKRPYLWDSQLVHDAAYTGDSWTPEDWASTAEGIRGVIDGFYTGGILTDQYEKDGVPALDVGEGFMRLSLREKHRVMRFVDYAFGITEQNGGQGMFYIYDARSGQPVGLYTKDGLQLQ